MGVCHTQGRLRYSKTSEASRQLLIDKIIIQLSQIETPIVLWFIWRLALHSLMFFLSLLRRILPRLCGWPRPVTRIVQDAESAFLGIKRVKRLLLLKHFFLFIGFLQAFIPLELDVLVAN